MPPKSIGTLKRKHGTLSATRESEKGGAIHASSAFAQPLWSAEEQALFNGEVARVARSTLCREALVESPQAAYAALANLRSPIDPELTKMLEIVANYVMEDEDTTSLHGSLMSEDAAVTQYLIAHGADVEGNDSMADYTPEDIANDEACQDLIEHSKALLETLEANPEALLTSAKAHCAALAAPDEPIPETALSLRAYHFDPCFLWAPYKARAKVFEWAQDIIIAQLAVRTPFLEELSDDCNGDILEFLVSTMTRTDLLNMMSTLCSSPEANAWVRAIMVSAAVDANTEKAMVELVPAAERGDLATVEAYIAKGVNLNLRGEMERTALMMASIYGHTVIVKSLLAEGATPHFRASDSDTALIYAASNGHVAVVKLLLKAGAEVWPHGGKDGWTALIGAAFNGHAAIVKLLIKEGADVDSNGSDGDTALMMASREGYTDIVKLLLKAGANKNLKAKGGKTAMKWAKQKGHSEVIALLKA